MRRFQWGDGEGDGGDGRVDGDGRGGGVGGRRSYLLYSKTRARERKARGGYHRRRRGGLSLTLAAIGYLSLYCDWL